MKINTYNPKCKVTLFKTIDRKSISGGLPVSERYRGTAREIDLTPFLSEFGGIRTTKSVREPAGGFTITLSDRPYGATDLDSIYRVVEPMDLIEIRMAHDTYLYSEPGIGFGAPVVMRGFVSEIARSESMGADGKPMRQVIISGQDYGKIWQMLQIVTLPGYVIGQNLISNFPLFERFGVGFQSAQKASDFVRDVINKIVNPYLKDLLPDSTTNPFKINTDEVNVPDGRVSVSAIQNQDGSIYDLLRKYGDVGVWNELYLEDREDGVYCVYRPNPAKDAETGEFIQKQGRAPALVDVPIELVVSLKLSRSDKNVANFFWVDNPRFNLNTEPLLKLYDFQANKGSTLLEHENSDAKLYGIRLMYQRTEQGPVGSTTQSSGLPENDNLLDATKGVNWVTDRRRILVEQNKDNVVLESGSLRMYGDEALLPGSYIRLLRGTTVSEYYVVQVDHEFLPMQGFFSTLTLERGTGFINRVGANTGVESPYLAELARKNG